MQPRKHAIISGIHLIMKVNLSIPEIYRLSLQLALSGSSAICLIVNIIVENLNAYVIYQKSLR